MTREEILALQAQQMALASAPKAQPNPKPAAQPPAGMSPDFYSAMVGAGATPHSPEPQASIPSLAPETPVSLPAPAAPPPAPSTAFPPPPQATPATIAQFPQQAPVMSQVSPAPAVAAQANINNNVTMPTPTFTQAEQRPALPTFQAQGLAPNLGGYGAPPSMPGYGMPRMGQPFKPSPPVGLPTFAQYSAPVADYSGVNPAQQGAPMAGSPDDYARVARQYASSIFNPYQ